MKRCAVTITELCCEADEPFVIDEDDVGAFIQSSSGVKMRPQVAWMAVTKNPTGPGEIQSEVEYPFRFVVSEKETISILSEAQVEKATEE